MPTKIKRLSLNEVLKIKPPAGERYVFFNEKSELQKVEIKNIDYSLIIIEAENIVLDTSMKGDGRHHYKVSFNYKNNEYKLCLTDPEIRKEELDSFIIRKAILIASLAAEPYGEDNLYYKFVAKVFLKQ